MGQKEAFEAQERDQVQEVKDKYTQSDIYYYYAKERGCFNNRGFKFPKGPFEKFISTKSKPVQENLAKITERFNTAWCNVDPQTYFYCAFKIFGKNFYYTKFFEPAILTRYRREKLANETNYTGSKERTKQGLKWMVEYIRTDDNLVTVEDYFNKKKGYLPVFVSHYLRDRINDMILAWVWINHKDWISTVDFDIQETYLRTFKKNTYKHISFLRENKDVYDLISHVFSKLS